MSAQSLYSFESDESSSACESAVSKDSASIRNYEKKAVWKPDVSVSESTKFASLFCLLNGFEFSDSKPAAFVVLQAKQCSSKYDAERIRCFEAIQFMCKKNNCPEFLQTCCSILDKFTNSSSDSLSDYLRHIRWEKISLMNPLEVFQENVVLDTVDNFNLLIQNRRTVLQDWASRMMCRFLVHFYKCMLLYMYLLKEQEKEVRSKHLKMVLDQRRKGLKPSLETSISPLFDPNFAILPGKSHVAEGGQEFMVCMRADEHTHFNAYREKSLASYFFRFWSRITSLNKLSISATIHKLLKLLQRFCRIWANHIAKAKFIARTWKKICDAITVSSEQDGVVNRHIKVTQQGMCTFVFQKWKQLNAVSKKESQTLSKMIADVFLYWRQSTKMQVQLSKTCFKKIADAFWDWRNITKIQLFLAANRNILKRRLFASWKEILDSVAEKEKMIANWSTQLSLKNDLTARKAMFEDWKRWYLARWISRSYVNKSRTTRALNAWIEYQILFIQKMITCASRVRLLRDTTCLAVHISKWKVRTAFKMNVEFTVIIQKMRVWLRVWNHNCGFGVFKTGTNMTSSMFCFNKWKKVSKTVRRNRQVILTSSETSHKRKMCKMHWSAWINQVVRRRVLEEKSSTLIFHQRLKPALLRMYHLSKIMQRIKMTLYSLQYVMVLAWKKVFFQGRKVSHFVQQRNICFAKKALSHFKMCCNRNRVNRGSELMLLGLLKKVKFSERETCLKVVVSPPESLVGDAHTHSPMKLYFSKWRDSIKDLHKTSFLEIMFRCGEISSMRRHFEKWKRLGQ